MARRIDWIQAKTWYVTTQKASLVDVAKKFRVTEASVYSHSKREDWPAAKKETLDAIEKKTREIALFDVAAAKARHIELGNKLIDLAIDSMDELNAKGTRRIRAESIKDITDLTKTGVGVIRDTLGLTREEAAKPVVNIQINNLAGKDIDLARVE